MSRDDIPVRPWQMVSMDVYSYAGKDILVAHYTYFWEIDHLPDLSADTLITGCEAQLCGMDS